MATGLEASVISLVPTMLYALYRVCGWWADLASSASNNTMIASYATPYEWKRPIVRLHTRWRKIFYNGNAIKHDVINISCLQRISLTPYCLHYDTGSA